jgi:uncharacterized protein (TIGR04255 family)
MASNSAHTETTEERFPTLERPPIVEVVCGVVFEPVELDGLVLGIYWDERKKDFPLRALQPALTDSFEFVVGPALPQRALLTSGDNVHVLQIQHDRFFLNWRATGASYPRFSTRGAQVGLRDQFLREYELLSAFCSRRGMSLKPKRVELSKIDVVGESKYWNGIDDLAKLLPITGTFTHGEGPRGREFSISFVEHDESGPLVVSVNSMAEAPGGHVRAARIETRAARNLRHEESLGGALDEANRHVNQAFFRLVNRSLLDRFGKEGT